MLKVTIDGSEIEVEPGTTVIQAADQVGIDIPRYCYHPGLQIVGVCRICLVEIERMPKLQVACYTPVADGMVVRTNSSKVLEARQAVMEFLLVNHPLDCPVCDQSGECWLQNFYMQHGLYDSQMIEDKVKKSKALPIGPNVMLDSERCILCTRCVRFCDDISKTHELGIFSRGDNAELLPYPGRELDNNYSGNTIDICPVGALTDRDFRFRTRVWYLSETPSVCPGCSTGCNINIHHNDKRTYKADGIRISRLKPRYNPDVNEWWMCDTGRYGFTYVDEESRLQSPLVRENERTDLLPWDDAIDTCAEGIKKAIAEHGSDSVAVILSPQMTNEDLFTAKVLFKEHLKLKHVACLVEPTQKGYEDDYLIKADKNPNTRGIKEIGLAESGSSVKKILDEARKGKISVLYICYHDLEDGFDKPDIKDALGQIDLVIFHGTNENATSKQAHIVFPAAAFVEKDGTFTNFSGRIQRICKAVDPLGEAKVDWAIFKRLSKKLGKSMPYFESVDVFAALSEEVDIFRDLTYSQIGEHGVAPGEERKQEARVA